MPVGIGCGRLRFSAGVRDNVKVVASTTVTITSAGVVIGGGEAGHLHVLAGGQAVRRGGFDVARSQPVRALAVALDSVAS